MPNNLSNSRPTVLTPKISCLLLVFLILSILATSGAVAKQEVTVSVYPDIIPIGTKIVINGKRYVAHDTGSKVKGNVIDIYFDNHKDALIFGCKHLDVYIIEN